MAKSTGDRIELHLLPGHFFAVDHEVVAETPQWYSLIENHVGEGGIERNGFASNENK